jgi:hypothetical protein
VILAAALACVLASTALVSTAPARAQEAETKTAAELLNMYVLPSAVLNPVIVFVDRLIT